MRLLTGTEIQRAISTLVVREGDVDVAVAYWGQDSLDRTGIASKKKGRLRVICDLLSGACNPAPIAALKRAGIPVLTLDRLHAKVWINGDDVILGSANASMAGLPMPNDDLHNRRDEADVEIRNETLAQSLRKWFEERWNSAREIEDRDLRQARVLWSQRRKSARTKNSGIANEPDEPGISDLWRSPPALRLLAYDEDSISPAAQHFHREEAVDLYTDEEWTAAGSEPPFYEWEKGKPDWTNDEGTVILDFSRPQTDTEFRFNGLWTVMPNPSVALGTSTLTLLRPTFDYNGKHFTERELRKIAKKIQTCVDQHGGEPYPFDLLLDLDGFALWDDERSAIRQCLVDSATETAVDLCRSGSFSPDITLDVFRICAEDPDWMFDYAKYVGADIFAAGNDRKNEINPIIGQRIREAIGGVVPKSEDGKRRTRQVHNELISSYTVMDGFDPSLVATDYNDE